ncbi:MAG: DEAD/DEAH box helicase [Alphaproteobacteria bacterium]|nr:DEAD/DEAH box helicase [Alphaproteobacteria bacterium]
MNFADLGLSEHTIHAIDDLGIKEPTTVQADVIPSILEGKDVFTIAPQGCGKTMSYVLPILDIISRRKNQTILIITPNSDCSVMTSDQLAVFNKYHEINDATIKNGNEDIATEANVIIGSPDLLVDVIENGKVDVSATNILVVDDINLIKKNKQLGNLEKILDMLPAEKQNIVYTNRRSKETQDVLEKILKTPEEIKIDKAKEQEAQMSNCASKNKYQKPSADFDKEAVDLAQKNKSFNGKTPGFILVKGILAEE